MSERAFLNGRVRLFAGDCLAVLPTLAENSVDAVVTDPPYHLTSISKPRPDLAGKGNHFARRQAQMSAGFMGKEWDGGDIAFRPETWAEVLRVLKPGGHLLAFGAPKNFHRLVCAIEDGGFEIRDCVQWLFGSGFPKSHDVSKGIQRRRAEDEAPIRAICRVVRVAMDGRGLKSRHLVQHFGNCHPRLIDHWAARDTDSQPALPTWDQWLILKHVLGIGDEHDREVWRLNNRKGEPSDDWNAAEIIGEHNGETPGLVGKRFSDNDRSIRAPTDEAAAWSGWGTALKPAYEPICLARKPLSEGSIAANVLKWGTGAINIDGCRIDGAKGWCDSKQYNPGNLVGGASDDPVCTKQRCHSPVACSGWGYCRERNIDGLPTPEQVEKWKRVDNPHRRYQDNSQNPSKHLGRWPANIILSIPEDEYQLRRDVTPEQKRELYGWLSENA